jgi:hypothetical protein
LKNKLRKFGAEFFPSGKAAGSVDTSGINRFSQRGALPHSYAHFVRYAVRFANRLKPGQKGNEA